MSTNISIFFKIISIALLKLKKQTVMRTPGAINHIRLIKKISILIIFFFLNATPLVSKSWDYHLKKGTLQFNAEMYDYALENLLLCLEKNPASFRAANMIAEILLVKNRKREALRYFDISLRQNINQSLVLNTTGELLELFAYNDKALKRYKKAIKIDSSNLKAHVNLVRFYIKQGDQKKSEKHFATARKLGIKSSLPLYNKGVVAENNNNLKDAEKFYREAIKLNPAMTEAHFRLADLIRKKNDYTEAVKVLENFKKLKPDYPKTYIYLGHIYFNRKLPGSRKYFIELSIKNLKQAARLEPSNTDVYIKLSEIYYATGDDINGKIFYEKAYLSDKKE